MHTWQICMQNKLRDQDGCSSQIDYKCRQDVSYHQLQFAIELDTIRLSSILSDTYIGLCPSFWYLQLFQGYSSYIPDHIHLTHPLSFFSCTNVNFAQHTSFFYFINWSHQCDFLLIVHDFKAAIFISYRIVWLILLEIHGILSNCFQILNLIMVFLTLSSLSLLNKFGDNIFLSLTPIHIQKQSKFFKFNT